MAITAFLFRSLGLLNREPGGPGSLGAGSLYRILSPTDLISNWLNFLCTELHNCSPSTFFLWASQIALSSTRPRSRLYPDIPRPDVPVIYTGEFPIWTAWPGRRLICNTYSELPLLALYILKNAWITIGSENRKTLLYTAASWILFFLFIFI